MIDTTTVSHAELADARLTMALKAGGVGTWQWNRLTDELDWDPALEAIFGLEPGTFGGTFDVWVSLIHPDDQDHVLTAVATSLERGDEHEVEHRIIRPDGEVRWLHCRGEGLVDDEGAVVGMHGVAVDLTERRAAEADRDRLLAAHKAARDRLAFLAEASAVLSRSLNTSATMTELAELTVPRLGDWCVVESLEQGELRLVAASHHDPAKLDDVRRWHAQSPLSFARGPGDVVRTGEPELITDIDDAVLQATARDDEHLQLLRSLRFRSAAMVPLMARGTVLGALTLIHDADSDRRHTSDDLALAEELAHRAGVALDNARLFQERATVASVLQRALLPPELPRVPGAEIAARHQPGAEMVIGGDFYDVFENADGSWTVLIGDVCGKDTTAASLTALARHSARAAVTHDSDPRAVLDVMNQAFRQHGSSEQFCTAVCARLHPGQGRADFDIAVAGHPPPLLLRGDGSTEAIEATGPLVGLFDDATFSSQSVSVGAGETLTLYTDGVTEARRDEELFGGERLAAALGQRPALEADVLADAVLRAVAAFDNGDRRDDVAVVTVQVPATEAAEDDGHAHRP